MSSSTLPTVQGVVCVLEQTKTFGQKGFRKRLCVLEQDKGQFSNYIPIDFTKDMCDAADQIEVGDTIEVAYFLNGRKWQRDEASEVKYFLSANASSFTILETGPGHKAETKTNSTNAPF